MSTTATKRTASMVALALTLGSLAVILGLLVGAHAIAHAAPAPPATGQETTPLILSPVLYLAPYSPLHGSQGDPTRYVAPSGTDSGPCTNPAAPCRTIQYAVNQATAGDEVLIATGVYTSNGQGQVVFLNKTITLRGGYTPANWTTPDPAANPTILDGENSVRVIWIAGGASPTVEGLHLRQGRAENGGGVLIESGKPQLRRNRLYSNTAILNGGGVYVAAGEPVLENNLIYANSTVAGRGGGLYVAGGAPVLQHNTLYGNQADEQGGGAYLSAGTPLIQATIIVSNTASQGGGVYRGGGSPTLDYNNVWANIGGDYGGGVSAGSHSTSTNPLFMDAAAADFHLQAGSPCRDWVPITQTVAVDFDGLARPFGPRSDIGAHEFYTGTCFARVEAGQVYTTVQAAVDTAGAGETVKVAGVCTGSGAGPVVLLNQALTLRGGYTLTNWTEPDPTAYPTILDGEGNRQVVSIGSVAAVVEGLHIRRGYLTSSTPNPAGGAGIYIAGGNPIIRHNLIYSNTVSGDAGRGAGIYAAGGQPLIQDNEIYANILTGQDGRGGGLCLIGSTPRVERNRIHHNENNQFSNYGGGGFYASINSGLLQDNDIYDNRAYQGGGGVFYESGNPTLRDNRIYSNTAQIKGGGLHIHAANPIVEENRFYGNQTTAGGTDSGGGAIYVFYWNCSPLIQRNDLYNNQALGNGSQGGAIHLYVWGSSHPLVERNAIHHNSAAGNGGGLLVRAAASSTHIDVRNNLIYGNTANNGGGLSLRENPSTIESNTIYGNQTSGVGGGIHVFSGSGHSIHNNILANNTNYGLYSNPSLSDAYGDVWGNTPANYGGGASAGTGSISQDPKFVNPAGNDLRLQAGSPCIDQADPASYPPEDYAGWARPFGPRADMGAYEFYSGTCFARVEAGQVYTNPQAAVDVAPDGGLVQVAGLCQGVQGRTVGSETFYQTVYISHPLTLRGGYTLTNWLTPTSVTTLDAQGGGRGVYLAGSGPITVEGFVIRGGSATTGGGLYLSGPLAATIQNVMFYGNTATHGGGLASAGGAPRLYNNTFAYNTATSNGGGLYLAGSTPVLSNTIVVSNSASTGGGLYVVPGTTPSLAYNDFWHNSGGDYAGISPGSTDLAVDPRFADPAGGDLHLRPDSPCLHTADPATTLPRDLEGDPRPLGRGYDIGADESSLYPDLILAPDRQSGGIPGQIIVYQHVLTNSGSITDSYHLTHTLLSGGPPAGWGAVDYTPVFTLTPGEVVAVPVAVAVPTDAISGSHAIVILTATSQVNPAIYDTVQNKTIVNWNPGVRLAPEYHEYVNPGTVISYVHILTNTGNAPDTFQIVWSSERGWTTVTPTLVSNLGPHLTATVWVSLSVPATMPGGEVERTALQVNSLLPGSGVSTAITDTFTVIHAPGDRYVTTGGDDTLNNCLVYTYPCATIEYAAGQAVTGDRVKVAAGTYHEHDILLNKRIILQGGYPANGPWGEENFIPELHVTTISADGKGRVLNILGNPTVEGFHLINGSTAGSGGAVYVSSGAPLLRRNAIHHNHADRSGGGVYNALGSLTLERNLFYHNSAGLDGGGFYHALGNASVWNNLFYGNSVSRNGGGLYTAAGSPRLWHNTLHGNQAAGYGGGIYLGGGTPTISNTILVSNTASLSGGGLYRGGGSPAADYNDVWANSGGDYGGGLSAGPHDLSVDPRFVNPGQADYHLQEGSPCIDRGDTTFLTEDLDGHPRLTGLAPDIGADEYLVVGVQLEPDNAGRGFPGLPITYTHVLTNIGFYTDTFHLAARSSHGWPAQALSQTVMVGPGSAARVVVMIQVPAGALSGTVDTTIVTATSGFSPYPFDTAVDTTTVTLRRGVSLEPDQVALILSNPSQPRPVLFPHLLTNTGNYTDTFNFTWSSSAGLPVTVNPAQATLGPGQSRPAWVTVTVPALNPDILLVDTTHITATSQFSPTVHDAVTDTTFVNRNVEVEFAPDNSGRGRPGETLLYTHTLTNTGNYTDTFQLTSSGWGTLLGPAEVTLGANASRTVEVEVIIPSLALSNTVNTTLITATSQFQPTIYDPPAWSGPVSDTVTDTTLVERVVGVDLRNRVPEGEGWCIIAPDVAVYTFRIINLGNYTDTFDITASSQHGWPVSINPNPVTIGPWQRSNILVSVSVPAIITQTEDLLLVTATSRADPSVSDSSTYLTRVNWNVDLELEPDRAGTVILENSIVYTHLLTNTGEVTNTFLVGGSSSRGWTLLVSPDLVPDLPPGGSVPVTVTLFIPPEVISAQDMAIISATTALYCPAYDSALDFTTVTRPHVTLYPDRQGEAGPGTAITYTHFVSNSGALADSYTLAATNSLGWPVQVIPTTTASLLPGEKETIAVVVHVPAGTEVGTVNTTLITATSHYTSTIFDTAVDTTTVPYLPGALLEPECHRQVDPGATVVCTHTLHNTGNYTETFYLTTHSQFAYAEVEPAIIGPLAPGETYSPVTVTIWIPAYAAGGQTEHTEVIVTFGGAEGQAATVDTTYINHVQGTRYVAPTGLDAYNNCLDLNYGPCATVQHAVGQALPPDLIKVATGVYTDLHTFDGNSQVVYLTESLTLRGGYTTSDWEGWDPDLRPTRLDAAGQGRVIVIAAAGITPTVEGFYLTGGRSEENGGGVYVTAGALPTLRLNTIYSNTAANGGGGLYSGGGNLVLERNTWYNNAALNGGGFYLYSGQAAVWNNVVYDNQAEARGGGLYILSGNPTLLNNTFYGNAAGVHGGGIYIAIGSPVISQTIAVNNVNYGLYNGAGSPQPAYNDLWGNSGGDSNIPPGPGSFSADPRFANVAQRNLHLSGASPCIDAGQPGATLPADDRDGSSRPLGLRHDVGAYEYRLFKAKQAPITANPGAVITYTLILTNSGAVPQPGVIVTDALHPYLEYAGTLIYSHGQGEYLTTSRTISWTGTVYPAAPTLITFTARITDWLAAGTEITNVAWVDLARSNVVTTTINAVPGRRHVATTGDDTHNNCLVPWKPCATIQYAVNQTLNGDEIRVAGGVYTDSLGTGCVVSITHSLTLTGGFSPTNWTNRDPVLNPTTLDAQHNGRGVCIAGPLSATLTGFRITAASGPGIQALNAQVTLQGNLVYDNSGPGLLLQGSQTYSLVNNILARNGDSGLRANGGSGLLLHNTFAENEPAGAVITGTATLTNTLFYSHPLGLDATAGTASLWHTLWYANATNATGTVISSTNLFGDPLFVAPAAADYHLQGDSIALSAGLWTGEGEDIDRDVRPADQPPDIGADQYPLRTARWVEPVAALPCEVVTHTLHLTSLDNMPVTGVQLREPLPAGVGFGGWVECSTGTCTYASGAITWLGSVETSTPTTIRYTAVLTPYLISGTAIVHVATITDSLSTFHSAPITVTARTTDALLTKEAPPQATIGQAVTYTLLYTVPAGHVAYQPLVVDRLPSPAMIYLPGSASPPPAQVAPDGSTITWTLPTVSAPCGAPQVVTVTFAGQVQDLPDNERGDLLTNTVALSYTEAAGGPAHRLTATRSLTLVEPVVNLDKQMAPNSGVGLLAPVHITLTLSNSGDSPLYDGVLTDTLPQGLEFVAATPGYQVSGQTVTWTLASLAPNTQAVYTLTAQVHESVEPGMLLVNEAGIEGSSLPGPASGERVYTATAQATATVGYPDLAVSKECGPAVRSPGQIITYTILYTNTGVLPAAQVRLVDTLPPLLTEVISATSIPATVERSGQIVTWTLPGMLSPQTGGTIWITGTISTAAQDGEVLTNRVSITSTTPEQNLENNIAWVTTTVRRPALSINKTASPSAVMPGDRLDYTLTVINSGQGEATGLIISDTVPLTTTYLSCSGGDSCGLEEGVVIWNVASLSPGSSVQVAFAVQVSQDAISGTYIENVSYGVTCLQGETAQGEPVRVPVAPAGDLTLEPDHEGEGRPGQQVVYTHTLTNASNVVQTINLSAVSSQGWAVSVTPTRIALPAGASTPVTVRVTVPGTVPSGTVDTTTVTAHGQVIGHDTATDRTTITGIYIYLPLIVRQH